MPNYIRASEGNSYFFTVVTYKRHKFLCDERSREALKSAINETRARYPFRIEAWVLLYDHLHCIWTLPFGDKDYSARWSMIKRRTSQQLKGYLALPSKKKSIEDKRESGFWQRRFWEHLIRSEEEFRAYCDYIHYNPVKHGIVESVADWPYSTFHKKVLEGIYPKEWGGDSYGLDNIGME